MYLVLMSDWHLRVDTPVARLDDYVKAQYKKLDYLFDYVAKRYEDYYFLQAGDLCHMSRSWFLLPEVYKYLESQLDTGELSMVMGQHDIHMYNEQTKRNTIVGMLEATGLVDVLNYEPSRVFSQNGKEVVTLYGASIGQEIPVPDPRNEFNVLIVHRMITSKKLWSTQTDTEYALKFLRDHEGYDLILCGDSHQKFIFRYEDRTICNAGVLMRGRSNDYDVHPGFWVYNTKDRKILWVDIPHAPAEEVLSREHIDETERENEMLTEFVSVLQGVDDSELGIKFVEVLIEFLEKNKEQIGSGVKELLARIIEQPLE